MLGSKLGYPVPGYYPDGIMSKAAADGTATGIIFVTINYRLGALGFLSGPEMMLEGGELNAGLLDQRFALEWVQEHIGLFGGDKNRVTVMGESAGGGSVFAHLAAYGGDKGGVKLFSGAIAQSPAFVPLGITPPGSYNAFLQHVGVGNLTEARAVDEATIIAANAATIGDAPASSYIFCPVVDGDLLPGNLATLLRQGRFDKSIPVLAAHNSLEGGFFFDPNIASEEAFEAWVNKSVPGLGANRLKYLSESLYPPIFDGSLGYLNMSMRQMSLLGEAIFDCNFNTIGEALDGNSFACKYLF